DDYRKLKESISPDFAVDTAARLMLRVQMVETLTRAQASLDGGDLERATEDIKAFRPIELGTKGWVDSSDTDTVTALLTSARESRTQPLIRDTGGAERFLEPVMRRGGFVSFAGIEKGGKCLTGESEVLLTDGRLRTIADIVRDRDPVRVVSLDEGSLRFVEVAVSDFQDNGERECFEVVTRTGRKVIATENPPLLTCSGWKPL